MAYNNKEVIKDAKGNPIPQEYDQSSDSYKPLQQMEYYGATVANRPNANTVPVGAVYCSVQTQEYWQSDGTNWVVV